MLISSEISLNCCFAVVVTVESHLLCHNKYLYRADWTLRLNTRIGNDFASAQQLLESLWAYEDWKSEKHIESDADFVARAEELRRHLADSAATIPLATSATPVSPASASAQQTGAAQDSACVVCMCAARSVVLIPCGHLAVCQSCYERLQQCPMCRSMIRGAIRSYMA